LEIRRSATVGAICLTVNGIPTRTRIQRRQSFPQGFEPNCDNYLIEAENGRNAHGAYRTYGVEIGSLGVHKHWNNAIDKKYSRNLGTRKGIEL
jgi:hypothetical protein